MKNYSTKKEAAELAEKSILTKEQLLEIRKRTPASEIEETVENGLKIKSVKAAFVKKKINLIFGWDYDFQIISKEYIPYSKEVSVHARLTIRTGKGTIIKEQFGEFQTNGKNIATGYKAAATNAFKKCVSELGFFWDIYGTEPEKVEAEPEEEKLTFEEEQILDRFGMFAASAENLKALNQICEKTPESIQKKKAFSTIKEVNQKRISEKMLGAESGLLAEV